MAGRKLLLADDSVTIRKVVDLTFADEGMQVTTVGNGTQAIEKLEEVSPDIVLVDIFMPGMSGYQVCEHIKRDERFRHIPVMLLVGSFEPFDEAEARRVGADDYLTKPFQSIRQLVSRVGALLGRGSAAEEETTRELSLPPGLAPPASEMSRERLERATADTAPLPRPAQEAKEQQQEESGARRREALHKDTVQEDSMIESAPLEDFGGHTHDSSSSSRVQTGTASSSVADLDELEPDTPRQDKTYDPMQETLGSFSAPEKSATAAASSPVVMAAATSAAVGGPTMGARMTNARLSDEALLELDEVLPSRSEAEGDDFILDLQDDVAFTMDSGTLEQYEEELVEAAPEAEEFVEAQLAGEDQRADFPPVEEPSMQTFAPPSVNEPEIPAAHDEAPASSVEEVAAQSSAHETPSSQPAGQITLSQLSPEVIDAIARRAVEQISERVVEEVAWEVVPQLAELLIKRHLEREKAQTQ